MGHFLARIAVRLLFQGKPDLLLGQPLVFAKDFSASLVLSVTYGHLTT
jgi:hypothetical protein